MPGPRGAARRRGTVYVTDPLRVVRLATAAPRATLSGFRRRFPGNLLRSRPTDASPTRRAMTSGDRPWRVVAAALAGALLLGPALVRTPRAVGDSGEYLLMTEALFRHGSTDLRPEDAAALDEALRKGQL